MRKKILSLLLVVMLSLSVLPLTSCGNEEEGLVLNVYNWEDYIAMDDYDMIAEFENYYLETYGKEVTVNYSTFGTCENMYNELQLTKKGNGDDTVYAYDLVCPSEYMIQKMIIEGMLEEFDRDETGYTQVTNYDLNVCDFIKDLFEKKGWNKYATVYNWGTMGYTYHPDYVGEDVSSWNCVFNEKYANRITIKDSIRDSYILALGCVHQQELASLAESYNNGDYVGKEDEYNAIVDGYLNDFSAETIKKAEETLREIKKNIYGFEVDSGKQDMASGKLWINFAWSGDAVYAMDMAEEDDAYLEYVVPEEGSNIFFDGWVMPKGANKELAQEFLNFMYREDNAIYNLDYICYSSPMVGTDVYDYVCDNYGLCTLVESDEEDEDAFLCGETYYVETYIGNDDGYNGESEYTIKYYDEENDEIVEESVEIIAYDVSYYFGKFGSDYETIYIDASDINRQLATMYPTQDIIDRCVVMQHIEGDDLKTLNNMWDSVKVGYMSPTLMIMIVLVFIVVVALIAVVYVLKKRGVTFERKPNPNLTLIKREEIKRK